MVVDHIEIEDVDYELVEKLELALEAAPPDGLTPSAAARKVRAPYHAVRDLLQWMVRKQYAHTSGNGAWTRYHAGRP